MLPLTKCETENYEIENEAESEENEIPSTQCMTDTAHD